MKLSKKIRQDRIMNRTQIDKPHVDGDISSFEITSIDFKTGNTEISGTHTLVWVLWIAAH